MAISRVGEALGEGAARGVMEPLAKVVSGWIGGKVPAGSWLRSEAGVSFVSGLGQFVEALSSKTPFGRVASDFVGDVLKSAFSNGNKGNRPSAGEVSDAGESWVNGFKKHADTQIRKAKLENLPALQERLFLEFEMKKALWEKIRREMQDLDSKEPDGASVVATSSFDWDATWSEIDDWFARAAAGIQARYPATKPKPVRMVGATGLPPVSGGSYGPPPAGGSTSGVGAFTGTLARGADASVKAIHREFNRGVKIAIVAAVAIAALVGLSLWFRWPIGLTVGIGAIMALPLVILYQWPTGTTLVGLAWLKWGPRGFMNPLLKIMGVLVTLGILLIWWPIWWQAEGTRAAATATDIWHTVVLGVLALAFFISARTTSFLGTTASPVKKAGGVVWKAVLVALTLVFLATYWLDIYDRYSRRSPGDVTRTYTVSPGESYALNTKDDVILVIPAGMPKPACIFRAASTKNLWTDNASGEVLTSADCSDQWRKEGPGKSLTSGKLRRCIGVWNAGKQSVTLAFHAR